MSGVWQTIRGYIWWTYKRGSMHYDVMVTLILLFIFLGPRWINFHDKPTERNPHPTGVVVTPDKSGTGFIYEVDAAALQSQTDAAIEQELLRIIEPIAGEVEVTRFEPVKDAKGRLKSYRAWVRRPYR